MRSKEAIALDQRFRAMQREWTDEFIAQDLERLAGINEEPFAIPADVELGTMQEEAFRGMQLFKLNTASEKKQLVLYIHGGGYVHQPAPAHLSFLSKLIKVTDAKVFFPIYPKAPVHDFRETYTILMELYRNLVRRYSDHKLVFMGDSAGAAICLGLGMSAHEAGLKQPEEYILFSPFVDMTLENEEIREYAKLEAMLDINACVRWGESWAKGTDPHDFRLSPLYGDLSALSRVTLFTGTWELLYPDELRFYSKLKEAGVTAELFRGEEMGHIYNVYPIPEADRALEEVIAERVAR